MATVLGSFWDFQLSKDVTALSRGTVGEILIGGGETYLTIIEEEFVASKVDPEVVSKWELLKPFGLWTNFCGEGDYFRL